MAPLIGSISDAATMGGYIWFGISVVGAFVAVSIVLLLCACGDDNKSRKDAAAALKDPQTQEAWKSPRSPPKANAVPGGPGGSPRDQQKASLKTSESSVSSGTSVVNLGPLPTVIAFKVGKGGKLPADGAAAPAQVKDQRATKTIASWRPAKPIGTSVQEPAAPGTKSLQPAPSAVKSLQPAAATKSVKPEAVQSLAPVTARSVSMKMEPSMHGEKSKVDASVVNMAVTARSMK